MNFQEAIEFLKKQDELRITITGDIGSGKSTFSTKLADALDMPRIYVGGLMREEAKKRGMTLTELCALQEEDDTVDRQMDQLQKEKSEQMEKGVFEGRTSWHFVKNPDVNVFLAVDDEEGARRVYEDSSDARDKFNSVEDVMKDNQRRKTSETERYAKYYGIDGYDQSNFDIVIDTTPLSIDEVFEKTIIAIANHIQNN